MMTFYHIQLVKRSDFMILKKGDEIRVIAPSRSMNILTKEQVEGAKKR